MMAAVFLASTIVSIAERMTVARAVEELNDRLLTAQNQVSALRQAYLDQETGQRGFMLTGDELALEPFEAGSTAASGLMAGLRNRLADDTQAARRLDQVAAAAARWRTEIAEPQIAQRRGGPIPPRELESLTLKDKEQFDELRSALGAVRDRINDLSGQQIQKIESSQRLANIAQIAAGCALVLVLGSAIALFQRQLTRPVNNLVREVRAVAAGDYNQQIRPAGPREIADIAKAVETLRDSLHTYADRIADTERYEEQARIATDLHDRIIQRVFRLGLSLSSATARPRPDLQPLIEETDEIIRDLREVIFNMTPAGSGAVLARLQGEILKILESSVATLGFTPAVQFDGPVDRISADPQLYASVLAATREALSDLALHPRATAAMLRITATDQELRITLCDNTISDSTAETNVIFQWAVPLSSGASAAQRGETINQPCGSTSNVDATDCDGAPDPATSSP